MIIKQSVLTALFGIFNRFVNPSRAQSFHARPHLPRKLRGPRRKVAVPRLSECISVEKECTYNVKSLRRRSKSLIPIITIDHFGSTNLNFPNFASKTALPTKSSLPKPVNTDSLTMTRPRIVRRSSFPVALPHSAPPPLPSARGSSPVPSRKEPKSNFPKVICKTASAADFNQESSYRIGCHSTDGTDSIGCSVDTEV